MAVVRAWEGGGAGIKEGSRRSGPSDPRQRRPASLGSPCVCVIFASIIAVLFFSWRAVGELSPALELFSVSLTAVFVRMKNCQIRSMIWG